MMLASSSIATESTSVTTSALPEDLFDGIYNYIIKQNLTALNELLQYANLSILDSTNRPLVTRLAAEKETSAIEFLQQHFTISILHLIAGYAEANQDDKVQEILEDKKNQHTKFDLLCFAIHGYARSSTPKITEPKLTELYNKALALADKNSNAILRVKVMLITGLLFGKRIEQAFAIIDKEEVEHHKNNLIEEAVFATALIGIQKQVNRTIANKQLSPQHRFLLQRKAMSGYAQGNHREFITNLLDNLAADIKQKLLRVAAFGYAKGNYTTKALAILENTKAKEERGHILQSIVAGLGKGGLRGHAASMLNFASTPLERRMTLNKLAELYWLDSIDLIKKQLLVLAKNLEEENAILETLFAHYQEMNDFDKASELLALLTSENKIIYCKNVFIACVESEELDAAKMLLSHVPLELHVKFLTEIMQAMLRAGKVDAACCVYKLLPPHESKMHNTAELVADLSKKGGIIFIAEILANQNNFVQFGSLYVRIDKALYDSQAFSSPKAALYSLANIQNDLLRSIFAADVEMAKQPTDTSDPSFAANVLLPRATQLNKLMQRKIITSKEEALNWIKLSPATANYFQPLWDINFVSKFQTAVIWKDFSPAVRALFLYFNPLPREKDTAGIWLTIASYLTNMPEYTTSYQLFVDVSSYAYKRKFFQPAIIIDEEQKTLSPAAKLTFAISGS